MAIAFRAQATATGPTGSMSITVPATVQSGDLLLLAWHTSVASQLVVPSGWTLVDSQHAVGAGAFVTAIWKIATSGDASSSIAVPNTVGNNGKLSCALTAWSGADQTTPLHKIAFSAITSPTTSHATPTVTTTLDNCEIVTIFHDKDSAVTTATKPAAYTDRSKVLTGGTGQSVSAQASKTGASGGAYGGESWTTDAAPGSAGLYTLALAPAITTQTIRPASDITKTNVTDQAGGTTSLFATVDETVLNAADYVKFVETGVFETKLSSASTPPGGSGLQIDYVLGLGDGATTSTWDVYLIQNTTQKAHWTDTVTADQTAKTHTLTGGEYASISDWTDLRMRFVLTDVS
jgi:hypothetical protein